MIGCNHEAHEFTAQGAAMTLTRTLTIAAALLALAAPAQALCSKPGGYQTMQADLVVQLNAERRARGLPAFVYSPKLDRAAQTHACDNARRHSISHEGSDGGRLVNRLHRVAYNYRAASENTGRGFANGTRAVQWWMNSPGHKKNMLMRQTRDVGVGIAMSSAPDSRLHWILVMGAEK